MSTLSTSKKIWQVKTSTKVYNTKYNAGASNNITRYNISLSKQLPFYIKHNIDIYSLKLKGEQMLFTPDRIFDTRFVENEIVSRDAEIVDYTWQYVNKSGERDKRFNNNKKLPICKYGQIVFKTEDGINVRIEFSNVKLKSAIQDSFVEFSKYHNEQIDNEQKNNLKSYNENNECFSPNTKKLESINENRIESEPLYNEVVEFTISNGKVSASLLQRKFRFGYNRAVHCINLLEQNGIIGPSDGINPRMVINKNKSEKK